MIFVTSVRADENLTDEQVCDQIVITCTEVIKEYEELDIVNKQYIEFLEKELKSEKSNKLPWYFWLVLGVGVGSQIGR